MWWTFSILGFGRQPTNVFSPLYCNGNILSLQRVSGPRPARTAEFGVPQRGDALYQNKKGSDSRQKSTTGDGPKDDETEGGEND